MIQLSTSEIERIELELTNTCNLKCPLCIREIRPELKNKHKHRPLEEIIKQLDTYENLKYITIAGPTSEPTLYPDLFNLIKYLITRDIEISLFINGDTHDELYYKKLGIVFMKAKGHIYFTICGSTQELHSRYRVGSDLETVLSNLDIIKRYTRKEVLTWIVFNYNQQDFKDNYHKFDDYFTEYFYTLPMDEHFQLNGDIHLPEELRRIYNQIDRTETDIECPAISYKFALISVDGEVNPCSLYRMYGDKHCFECSASNNKLLRENKIYNIAEPESETSEVELRL